MRIRRKPWARPELSVCPFFMQNACENVGRWKELFAKEQPLHVELGCGKGEFISQMAAKHLDINYIAIDIKSEMLAYSRRNIVKRFAEIEQPIENVKLVALDISRIDSILSGDDSVARIYINFCNPWPKARHKKRRLTYPSQLEKYKKFLTPNGEIYFKTDDDELFCESVQYFIDAGFKIIFKTNDLHSEYTGENVLTEHEKMFLQQGIKIKFLIARLGVSD